MAKILILDKNVADLKVLESILAKEGNDIISFSENDDVLSLIYEQNPKVVLIDNTTNDGLGYKLFEIIKKERISLPVIFINKSDDSYNIVKSFDIGGADSITKPFIASEVKRRIATQLQLQILQNDLESQKETLNQTVQKQVQEVTAAQMATIFSLAKLAQSRDDSGMHLERIQRYCYILAEDLSKTSKYSKEIDETFIKNILHASPLHDIGKVGIPDRILLKPARLSFEEFEIMKTHTLIGAETLELVNYKFGDNSFIEMGIKIALSHHERWDGKGYPHKLCGEAIPLPARIMAIADVYDALRNRKVYKSSYSKEKTNSIIIEGTGTQFDPVIAASFKRVADKFDNIFNEWTD